MSRQWIWIVAAWLAGCEFHIPEPYVPPPNVDPLLGCSRECHGDDTSNAPPRSASGATETVAVAVGAHRAHMNVAPTWHRQIACADCHVVPPAVEAPGHLDGDGKAEVTFSMIAGPSAAWNGTTCTTRCHGSAAIGGAQATPTWTRVDGSQATCGSCHGRPPPSPHPTGADCSTCHPTMEAGAMLFRDPDSHINGTVETADPGATGGCAACHGSATSAAPPRDLLGNTAPTARGVGAHAAHLAPSTWHRQLPCRSCHVVPIFLEAPRHLDGDDVAEVTFNAFNPVGAYAAATARCSNLYCHGNGRDSNGAASWVTPGALGCGACHSVTGANMSGAHQTHVAGVALPCAACHSTVVDVNRTIINANLHVNGVHEVKLQVGTYNAAGRSCSNIACHDTRTW